ncbi:hypothetical protein ACFY93_31710 [Streptomyces sp. NPDC008313]|uniref:hypothetical protein n=1 Tax=Streptomyces sp. NPDC008313 TaxID=3364826 RepID=UPI0036E59861
MSETALDPEQIPQFTGNLEQLEKDVSALSTDGSSLWSAGSDIDTTFQGLSSYYKAPEAEKLFATTGKVATEGDALCTELGTISSALGAYLNEIRPLVKRLDDLREEARAFRANVASHDDWREDPDNCDENNNRWAEVNKTWTAFQAAESTCYAKIVALYGGDPLILNDGTNKENMYGYRAEDLEHAEGLPWGDPVTESTRWYQIHEHLWDFTKGFFVDGVWGTIKGLGTLVGFDGWSAAGQAWTGLGKLLTGIVITAVPVVSTAYWLAPDDKLPSWLRDSRTAVVETGKALIAYDEWGKNPSRAAGAVTFNVLTTIFTGGSGTAAKTGAIAKAISFAGKAGRIVDPMTYIAKGIGAGAVKISDVMASLRNVTNGTYVRLVDDTFKISADQPLKLDDLPEGLTPENTVRMETEGGKVVYLDTKTLLLHNADGTVRQSLADMAHEGTAAERGATASHETPAGREVPAQGGRQLAGVGAHVGDTAGAVGRGGDDLAGAGGRGGSGGSGGHGGSGGSGGLGGLDDLGHAGDDGLGDVGNAGDDAVPPGGHPDNGGGAADNGQDTPRERTPEEQKKIIDDQIAKANDPDKSWFDKYYRSDGHRRHVNVTDSHGNEVPRLDENGHELPLLAKDEHGNWIAKDSLPPKPSGTSTLDPGKFDRKSLLGKHVDQIDPLDKASKNRHLSKQLTAAERAFADDPSAANKSALEAAQRAYDKQLPGQPNNSSIAEALGEEAARRHVIPQRFPDAQWVDLPKTPNGANMFDQLYKRDDGSLLIVEAKAPKASLIWRKGAGAAQGWMVKQGSRDYIVTIIEMMESKGGLVARDGAGNPILDSTGKPVTNSDLAEQLADALENEKLQYVMVKAKENTGLYAGATLEHFKLY